MNRERAPFPAIRDPGSFGTDPSARVGGAVLRGVAVHHEPRRLARPAESRAAARVALADEMPPPPAAGVDVQTGASGVEGTGPGARVPAAAPSAFEEGRIAGRAEAEAAHQAALEDACGRGYQAGFDQGLEEGRQKGAAEAHEAARQASEREAREVKEAAAVRIAELDRLVAALPGALARRLESAEDDAIALCHAAVCRILGEQLLSRDGVAAAVREAIRNASALDGAAGGPLAIHLHPRDLELLRGDGSVALWPAGGEAAGEAIRWIGDEGVQLGGCIVSSSEGSLDARIEAQLAALREVLLRGRSEGSETPPAGALDPATPPAGGSEEGR